VIWRRHEHLFDWAEQCPELITPGGHVRRVRPYRATLVVLHEHDDPLEVCELVGIETIAVDQEVSD
jgi:hypothetical protein